MYTSFKSEVDFPTSLTADKFPHFILAVGDKVMKVPEGSNIKAVDWILCNWHHLFVDYGIAISYKSTEQSKPLTYTLRPNSLSEKAVEALAYWCQDNTVIPVDLMIEIEQCKTLTKSPKRLYRGVLTHLPPREPLLKPYTSYTDDIEVAKYFARIDSKFRDTIVHPEMTSSKILEIEVTEYIDVVHLLRTSRYYGEYRKYLHETEGEREFLVDESKARIVGEETYNPQIHYKASITNN